VHSTFLQLFFFFIVWLAWIPNVVLEKKAKGDVGGTSFLPIIPIFPLVAWGITYGLNLIRENIGTYLIGGAHIVLLGAF
jgi:hypothetical protein